MKKVFALLFVAGVVFASCSKKEETTVVEAPVEAPVEAVVDSSATAPMDSTMAPADSAK